MVGLKPWEKLLGQVIAACLAYWGGLEVTGVAGHAAHGWWTLPITVVWLVGCTNAFNLIDGVDGLATGVGLFATFTMLMAALLHGNGALALATAPLVGALLAFLRYNFNPASIFLGDSGSLTIGFLLGCFGAVWSQKSATLLGMTAPLMALSVPLSTPAFRSSAGSCGINRFSSPIATIFIIGLLDRGLNPRQVVLALYSVCGVAAAFSVILSTPNNRFDGILLLSFCVVAWVAVQFLGYSEFDTARQLVVSGTFRHILNARVFVTTFERNLTAAKTPEDYWKVVREVSREFGFGEVRMCLTGKSSRIGAEGQTLDDSCTIRIPLSSHGYVNFRYPNDASVRHAVAISSVVEVLQRSIALRRPDFLRGAPADRRGRAAAPVLWPSAGDRSLSDLVSPILSADLQL